MDNSIEKKKDQPGAKTELSKLGRDIESAGRKPIEAANYDELVLKAKKKAAELRKLRETGANLEVGSAEHALVRKKMGAAEHEATQLLVNIQLADTANDIVVQNEDDPAFRMPHKYEHIERA